MSCRSTVHEQVREELLVSARTFRSFPSMFKRTIRTRGEGGWRHIWRGLRHAQTVYWILAAFKCWSKQAHRKIMHAPYRIAANDVVQIA